MQDTKTVIAALQVEGFRLNRGYVIWAMDSGHVPAPEVKIGGAFAWTEADVDRMRQFLRRQGRWSGRGPAVEGR